MRTEAGMRLLGFERLHDWGCPYDIDVPCRCSAVDDVAAIEAEAVAAERVRITEAVRGLWSYVEWPDSLEGRVVIASYNSALAAVLAIVNPEETEHD